MIQEEPRSLNPASSCRGSFRALATRQWDTVEGPHPLDKPGAIAGRSEHGRARRPCQPRATSSGHDRSSARSSLFSSLAAETYVSNLQPLIPSWELLPADAQHTILTAAVAAEPRSPSNETSSAGDGLLRIRSCLSRQAPKVPAAGCRGSASGPRPGGAWGTAKDSRRQQLRGPRPCRGGAPRTRNRWSALSHGIGHRTKYSASFPP
jgi:hypothetical protein